MSAAQDSRDAGGVGYNHYVPRQDTQRAQAAATATTALCGSTFTLEPPVATGALLGTHAATELPVCPDCRAIHDKGPGATPAAPTRPVACEPWCTHPEDLGDGTSEDDGCWSSEQIVPAASLPDGWTMQLQSYVLDGGSGIVLAQGELHPVTMSPAEARQLAAALIAHADAWEGR